MGKIEHKSETWSELVTGRAAAWFGQRKPCSSLSRGKIPTSLGRIPARTSSVPVVKVPEDLVQAVSMLECCDDEDHE